LWIGGYQGTYSSVGSLYAWGAQLEDGAFPTSYIPTTSSTAIRSEDVASMTGTNFSSWYNTSGGTLKSHSICNVPSSASQNNAIFTIFNQSGSNSITNWYNTSGDYKGSYISVTTNYSTSSYLPINNNPASAGPGYYGLPIRQAFAFSNLNFNVATNGIILSNDLAYQLQDYLPTDLNRMLIGYNGIFATYLNGTISRLTYYPKALKPSQLIYLTQ
jgi:hypothetical protein